MNRLFCFINIWSTFQIIRVYTPDEVQLWYCFDSFCNKCGVETTLSLLILLKINCAFFFRLYFLQYILFIYISNQTGGDEECSRVLTYFCSVASLL